MDDSGKWPARPGADVRRRSGNGAGDANAAEQAGCDVRHALGDQLAIRAVPPPGHAVGHRCGEQRFDRAEQGERKSVGQNGGDAVHRDWRQVRRGQGLRNPAETRADGFDRQAEQQRPDRGHADGDQESRPVRPPAPQAPDDRNGGKAHPDSREVERGRGLRDCAQFRDQRTGLFPGQGEAEQIMDLTCEDDQRDGRGEADRHRVGNVFDVRPKPQKSRCHQNESRQHRREQQSFDAVPLDAERHQHDESASRPADLEPAAAEQRDEEAAENRGVKAAVGCRPRSDRNCHRGALRVLTPTATRTNPDPTTSTSPFRSADRRVDRWAW